MKFQILKQDKKSRARLGEIKLAHGTVETPAFVPVGTQASVKVLSPKELKEIGVQIFFANTYHLYLRPGAKVIAKLGGVQKFMSWNGPLMTDSGGFQVFSLGLGKTKLKIKNQKSKIFLDSGKKGITGETLAEITEEGVHFKSHLDGSSHLLTPEKSMQIQHQLGADIMMAFDDCTPYPCDYDYARSSMERTHRWAVRSQEAHSKSKIILREYSGQEDQKLKIRKEQNLFGVVQGSTFEDLRIQSAKFIDSLNTPGIAIGGVSVGESKMLMYKTLEWVIPYLSEEKSRHLLGVGEIDDVFESVSRGVDTMDCVIPTRWARNGTLLVHPQISAQEKSKSKYRMIINNAKYIEDSKPIDSNCHCYVCQNFSRAYLNHLYRTKEILGIYLGTYHNIYFMIELMKEIREAIATDRFEKMKQEWLR